VAAKINGTGQHDRKVEPAPAHLFDCIEAIPTPGHTADHHSLRFECEGLWVVIAGDAVMTHDFWRDRRGFFNSADIEQAGGTIERLAEVADAIAPGHDNWFLTGRGR
jgi:glyoxylase-like metal-dependent hydrolase (beta-lactamase superfamily II)